MKLESIEERKRKRKKEAVYGLLGFTVLQVICAAAFGSLCFIPELPMWLFALFFALAVLCLALVIPVMFLLRVRFKEIEGGELDAAAQY